MYKVPDWKLDAAEIYILKYGRIYCERALTLFALESAGWICRCTYLYSAAFVQPLDVTEFTMLACQLQSSSPVA